MAYGLQKKRVEGKAPPSKQVGGGGKGATGYGQKFDGRARLGSPADPNAPNTRDLSGPRIVKWFE